MANVTLLHRDRQEDDYVGGKRQNLMTLVYNALYQQVDYSYRQNGQLSQMGEFSLFIRFGACCSWQLPPAGQSWGVPEELGGYPAHMGIVAQAPHHIQVICKKKHKCSDDGNRKHKERIKKWKILRKSKQILEKSKNVKWNFIIYVITIVQGPPQMHQPVARRPITGSVGNYYPQVKLFPSHFFLFVSYLLGNVNHTWNFCNQNCISLYPFSEISPTVSTLPYYLLSLGNYEEIRF